MSSAPVRPAEHPARGQAHRWQQVYRSISEQISRGVLVSGDRLQGERSLSEGYGVGRTTIRRALAELERDGLIESHPGRGNFVSGGPLSESNALVSLGELAAARGLTTTSDVRRAHVRHATLEEADLFGIAPGASLFDLQRLRYLDGLEFALADSLVPLAVAPGIEDVDFRTASLYAELGVRGAFPVRAEYSVWAEGADDAIAPLLGIEVGDPVLVSSTRARDQQHRVVQVSRVTYRADRYRLQTVLTRQPSKQRSPSR
jgi:GntR family transcriptional regulator